MPHSLRGALEQLSGVDLSSARVHYNSSEPQRLGANAYAQANNIYLGAGQEHQLPHEAWHLVQQKQGRVRPTGQRSGVATNLEPCLEREADEMGSRIKSGVSRTFSPPHHQMIPGQQPAQAVAQLAPAKIKRVEIFTNANEVKITLENGKRYTYPLITDELENPTPIDPSNPPYQSGTRIKATHKKKASRDKDIHVDPDETLGKFRYNWSFEGVAGQPELEDFPPSDYDLIFYLKGSAGSGESKGEGKGKGDKKGEGEAGKGGEAERKGQGGEKKGGAGGKKKASEKELKEFIKKVGGSGEDIDKTPLTDEEKQRVADALGELSSAEEEQFLSVMDELAQQCEDDPACTNKGLADLLEFYQNLDEASREALSINQMLKADPTSESSELPEEVLLNIETDAKATAASLDKAKKINSNLALIQSKITDPKLKKEFEEIDLNKLSELNTLIMIQGMLAGASERLPELQPVTIGLTSNIGRIRDFILEEIAWLSAEIAATALFSALTAPVSGGASLAAGAAAAGHLAIRLNKLRKLIRKIQNLMEVVDKIRGIVATFQTVRESLAKADRLLKTFQEKREQVRKLRKLLDKGEASVEQIRQMENLEDELLELMLGSEERVGMIEKLEPIMDQFFLPEDLSDEELKQLVFDVPDGITAVEEMLAYKRAVEGGNADQTVTLSLKGFRAGFLLAPFVGFLTGTINDKLAEIMADKDLSERLLGIGGRRRKGGAFKGSKTKPRKRLKQVKTNKQKRAEAKRKSAEADKQDKRQGKKKDKDDASAGTSMGDSRAKWRRLESEIQAIGKEAKEQGGMTQVEVKKKATTIARKPEYRLFEARVDIDAYPKDPALNRLQVEDKGSTKIKVKGGGAKKRRRNSDILVNYLRPERERHKALNAAIRDAFKNWPEDKSDTKGAIEAKLDELKKRHGYPVQFKYPAGKAKEKGKVFVEAEKVKGDIIAWRVMTSLREGKPAEIARIDRPGNYWGSKNNPIELDWKKPAITDSKHYEPLYVGPYVAGEARVTQAELKDHKGRSKIERQALADDIESRVSNTGTKDKVKEWKKNPKIEKFDATTREKLPSPSRTTVGVADKWQIKAGTKLFPFVPKSRDNESGAIFTNKFRLFGFYAAEEGKDGDHVWEIQVGGPNKVENMWTLESGLNQRAGGELEKATVKTPDNKSKSMKQLKKEARENIKGGKKMWVRIKSTK
ncbi:hypothetical protein GCM10007160_03870 [Litchfieldella qijiaojingensis]|uniref:eCIS core domain-containing protein n=1 Tax=Litchfieldella qijiaojingensis TaxID=980347 RepID=A0ABQ2YDL8_9GAMM|nr:hypothetical protein GCM10007160_03870 [Halomonas qijiaojingensis]